VVTLYIKYSIIFLKKKELFVMLSYDR
jgi:hypothetical protein